MELKELKKEVEELKKIDSHIKSLDSSWLKQIKKNTNSHFPFLQDLGNEIKKQVNNNLLTHQKIMAELNGAQFVQEKMICLAKYLIDLKLARFRQEKKKEKMLVNKFVKDRFLNLKSVVDETKQIDFNLNNLQNLYNQTNRLIVRELPLEESVIFMDAEHKVHLNRLLETSEKQKRLLKKLGLNFISLMREK